MTGLTKQLADALRRYAHQDEQAGQTDNNLYRTVKVQLATYEAQAAEPKQEPVALSDERIDAIADLIVKGMPDGLRGFCRLWGWQQFARALLEDCAGHCRAAPVAQAEAAWRDIETAPGRGFILVAAPSGYRGAPLRVAACEWSPDYEAWMTHSHDRFTDGGNEPAWWMPLPQLSKETT